MTKQLYLEAIEALRQWVEAIPEDSAFLLAAHEDGLQNLEVDFIQPWASILANQPPEEYLDLEQVLVNKEFGVFWSGNGVLGALAQWVELTRNREAVKRRILDAIADRRRFLAAEEPPAPEQRPDAPGADAWDWVTAGSDDWDENSSFWEDDDPDRADEYGDEDEEDESGWLAHSLTELRELVADDDEDEDGDA